MDFVDKAAKHIDDGEIPFSIFIDLSKAFDTLDHNILLKKLQYYGIRNTHLAWFKSYLTDRTQSVKYNNTISSKLPLKQGYRKDQSLVPFYS